MKKTGLETSISLLGNSKSRGAAGAGRKRGRSGQATSALRLGLTGGLASGKSSVLKLFEKQGWQVLSADQIVHEIYRDWGWSRQNLREQALKKPQEIRKLEARVHPEVRRRIRSALKGARKNLIVEIPLLFESPLARDFDLNLFVYAPQALRKQRALQRGMSRALFERLESRQMSALEKAQRSDFVIANFSKPQLRKQCEALMGLVTA